MKPLETLTKEKKTEPNLYREPQEQPHSLPKERLSPATKMPPVIPPLEKKRFHVLENGTLISGDHPQETVDEVNESYRRLDAISDKTLLQQVKEGNVLSTEELNAALPSAEEAAAALRKLGRPYGFLDGVDIWRGAVPKVRYGHCMLERDYRKNVRAALDTTKSSTQLNSLQQKKTTMKKLLKSILETALIESEEVESAVVEAAIEILRNYQEPDIEIYPYLSDSGMEIKLVDNESNNYESIVPSVDLLKAWDYMQVRKDDHPEDIESSTRTLIAAQDYFKKVIQHLEDLKEPK